MNFKLFIILSTLAVYSEASKSFIVRKSLGNTFLNLEQNIRTQPNSDTVPVKKDVNLILSIGVANGDTTLGDYLISLDTTTSDFWIISSDCKSPFCHDKDNKIPSGKEADTIETSQVTGTKTQISLTFEDLVMSDVNVIAADSIHPGQIKSVETSVSGVLGIGPNSVLKEQMKPNDLVFLVLGNIISGNKVKGSSTEGTMYINEYPTDIVRGTPYPSMVRIKSLNSDMWTFSMNHISTNVGNRNKWCNYGCYAVVDAQSSMISGPADDINSLNAFLGADDDGNIHCYKKDLLEPLIFHIRGKQYKLHAKNFIIKGDNAFSSRCKTVFEASYTYNKVWRLGVPFLQQFLTVFDYVNGKIDFLTLKQTYV